MGLNIFIILAVCYTFVFCEARVAHLGGCEGVEYRNLGCFDVTAPFNNTRWFPQSPSFVRTSFMLFTRQNRLVGRVMDADHRPTIHNAHFDASKPTKIVVHGFLQNANMPFLINTTRALLEYGDMNVIVVGWSGGAGFPYGQAAANTRLVGAQVARLVNVLSQETGLATSNVHIIGHSLGAHVAGSAGARIPRLARITALDPAQPNFHGFGREVRLDTTDADLVDVIHTDGSPYSTVGGYGMMEPVGHIDFYPNGGHNQPGCYDENSFFGLVEDAWSNGVSNAESHISCSHERSVQLFAASIEFHSPCSFRAFACESEEMFLNGECTHCGNRRCPIMGFHADRFPTHGVFYLNTTSTEPFCGHHYHISMTLDPNMGYTQGTISVQMIGSNGETEWTELKTGEINGGEVISKMILSQANVDEILSVQVRFVYSGSMFAWGSDSHLMISRIKATNLRRMHPKYFCQPNMRIENGQGLTLSQGSYEDTACSDYSE